MVAAERNLDGISSRATLLAASIAVLVSACSSLPDLPSLPSLGSMKPYRIDIQQGNFLSPEMVAQLKRGMTREQVRFVLGTPLVTDVFHADRWDYVFYRELGSGTKEQKRLSVFFQDEKLARIDGDMVPPGGLDAKAEAPEALGRKEEAKN
jgi:outer membrane protein assembly factor BamE